MNIGSTVDDAIGEAFDKSAKMIGPGFPRPGDRGSSAIGRCQAFRFPAPDEGSAGQ